MSLGLWKAKTVLLLDVAWSSEPSSLASIPLAIPVRVVLRSRAVQGQLRVQISCSETPSTVQAIPKVDRSRNILVG